MAISFNTLDNTITTESGYNRSTYLDLAWAVVRQLEGATTLPYLDTVGKATIGVGFNIEDNSEVLRATIEAMGLDPDLKPEGQSRTLLEELSRTAGIATTDSSLRSQLNDAVRTWTGDPAKSFALPDTSDATMRPIWDKSLPDFEAAIPAKFAENGITLDVPYSRERVALLSLAYNNPALIGSGLTNAINNGDRAEAWFEIRYNSNSRANLAKNQDGTFTDESIDTITGIAKRRMIESHIFGLYEQPDLTQNYVPTLLEALQTFRTFSKHERKILSYDADLYHLAGFALVQGDLSAMDANTSLALGSVTNGSGATYRHDALLSAFQKLQTWYATIRDSLNDDLSVVGFSSEDFSSLDIRSIFVAANASAGGQEIEAHIINRDTEHPDTLWSDNNDGSHTGDESTRNNDLIFGSIKDDGSGQFSDDPDTLKGGLGNDIIIDNGGADKLFGGTGNDLLISGAGNDELDGGEGDDALFAERLAARHALAQPGSRHVGPVGKIDDWLRWPGLCFLQRLDRQIARLKDRAQRNCHDAVRVGFFAFASDDGLSILEVEDWDGPACPSAVGAARSFPEYAGCGGIFAPFRFETRRAAVRAFLRHTAQLAKDQ